MLGLRGLVFLGERGLGGRRTDQQSDALMWKASVSRSRILEMRGSGTLLSNPTCFFFKKKMNNMKLPRHVVNIPPCVMTLKPK